MCFGLSCLFACLLLLGPGKFDYSLVPTLISFRRTALPRAFSALSGFMPPKRTTRNSLSTYFDMASDPNSDLSPVSPGLPASSSSSAASVNFVVSSSSASGLSLDSLTASIVNAIRPLLSSGRPSDQSGALSLPAAAPPAASSSFSLPGPSLSVASTSPSAQLPVASSSGRPVLVPSFVNTFAVPTMSSLSLPASSLAPCAPSFSLGLSAPLVSPSLQQPFIVGPGFSPVPYKIVSQIVAGKFIDLAELLSVNLRESEAEPQLLFDGRIVLSSTKRPKRKIDDILAWSEAFSIFSLILATHFPSRWRDLTLYKLLILRTYRQFQGNAWLAYDRAFREHAAAARLTDWSSINVQLFNFHAAGSSVRRSFTEPTGSSSAVVCKSWNNGFCVAPSRTCRFAHRCSVCSSNHRALECSQRKRTPTRSPSPDGKKRKRHQGCLICVNSTITFGLCDLLLLQTVICLERICCLCVVCYPIHLVLFRFPSHYFPAHFIRI